MKNYFATVFILLLSGLLFAQAPTQIKYQGVARDAAGAPIANGTITVQFDIRAGSPTGTIVYTETHSSVATNTFGLFSLNMGSVTPLSPALFGAGLEFLEVSVDFGSGLTSMATSQLLSVPYALYAETSGNGQGPTGATGLSGLLSSGTLTGNTPYWDGSQWVLNNSNIHNNGAGVGIGTTSPSASAKVEITSTTQGLIEY